MLTSNVAVVAAATAPVAVALDVAVAQSVVLALAPFLGVATAAAMSWPLLWMLIISKIDLVHNVGWLVASNRI